MKKYISAGLVSLLTLGIISACSDNNINTPEQQNNVTAQAVKKNRSPRNLIKINVKDKEQINDLVANGIDLFGSGTSGNFDAYVTDKQAEYIKSKNIKIAQANNAALKGGLPAGYHTVDQVLSIIRDYAAKNPSLVKLTDIGDSWEKTQGKSSNDIWALTVTSNKQKANKSTAVFISGMHSRELLPVEVNLKLMDLLISSYGKDPEITKYLDTREVIFVPLLNIDGRRAVENGDSMWRKNRHIDNQYDGIDLNRNFDGHWNFENVEMTSELKRLKAELENKDSEIYSGPNKFSEPETQALNQFLNNKKVNIMMDLHAYGNMVLYPPGYTSAPTSMTPLFKKVAKVLTSKNGYKAGTSIEILYPSCGTSKDWGYDRHQAIAFTMEMGSDADGFRPPFSKVESVWNLNKDGLVYLVSIADNPSRSVK
ncbi:MAG: M14 family zinc carboxypeptidase [Candidatus Sericytochromatia bacterium]